jgi:hypothetical protein
MALSILLPLLPLLSFLTPISAQSSGTFTIDASNPSSGSGCIIIAQVASLSTPNVLTALIPICPSTAGEYASGDLTVSWPLTTSGDGASSSLAIYGELTSTTGGVKAGCVTSLSQMQAMYLLGRSLEWRNDVEEVYDNTAGGFLLDPTTYNEIPWYVEVAELL